MNKKLINFFIFFFFVSSNLLSQTYNFVNYNVNEGLEQSDILCVSQAKNGYLLYGSNGGGLGYYNGYKFNAIKEKNGLANNVVFSISIDNENNIWCATNNGVSQLTPSLKKIKQNLGVGTPFYCSFYNKELNILYFGSKDGLYYYDNSSDTLVKFKSTDNALNNAFVNSIYTDSKNNLWVATRENGLFAVTKERVINYTESNGMPSNYIKTVIELKDKIWAGTLDGAVVIENESVIDLNLINNASGRITITSATTYKDELVFGALNNQFYFINPINNSYREVKAENGFNFKKVWSVYTDAENNLWFGTLGQGLVKFSPTFTYYNDKNGLLNNYINTIYCDGDETWLGYKNQGINVVKNHKIIRTITSGEIGTSTVNRITKIDGEIYIGTNLTLCKYENNHITQFHFSENKVTTVYAIYKYKTKIYVGTSNGLYQFLNNELIFVKGSPKDVVFDIVSYKDELYLGCDKGYCVYDGSSFKFIDTQEFNVGRVRGFVVSKNGLWIGTNEGVFVKKEGAYFKLDEDNGLTSDNVYFLRKDEKGNVWAGTNKGVDRINIASVLKCFNDSTLIPIVRNYSSSEGMQGVECNMNAVDIDVDGKLWIGTINGAFIYNQKEDNKNIVPPRIILNNIKLNFNDVDWLNYSTTVDDLGLPNNLELSYKNNNLIFEYVGISLKNPEKLRCQFQLEGWDEKWRPLTKDRKAGYTALSPGNYTFKIKAKNNDDVWSQTPVSFSFSISPPWYQTKLFYGFSVIFLLLVFYLIIYFRTRNLKKARKRLTKKVEERTKELRKEKEKVEHVNVELGEQKKAIEIANTNITDSINYAKKIQDAILPNRSKLGSCISNVDTVYMPKDVVSGDFYWFEKIGEKLILVVADCTGHGVPGAFMSMIGVNNLNQIILEKNITNPSTILSELNKAIKAVLQQNAVGSESRDGMDVSICCFNLETKKVQYAGAFRPLIYIRNNELHEIKGSRNPIGGIAPLDFCYSLSEFEFKKEDVFYMFSDGYADQFGGPKGKKFMTKRLKQLLLDNYTKTPAKNVGILKGELIKWMGDEEQVDDVLLMCVKL